MIPFAVFVSGQLIIQPQCRTFIVIFIHADLNLSLLLDWPKASSPLLIDVDIGGALDLMASFFSSFQAFSTVVMQSLLYVSASWSSPSTQLLVIGDLTLHQQSPLPASGTVTTYNTSLFNDSSLLAKDYQITSIMDRYHERNSE